MGRIRSRGTSRRIAVFAAGLALVATTTVPGAAAATGHATAARPMPSGGTVVGHGTDRAVIVRDSYGVPSIYSKSTAGMWFGAGWAQAQDRLVQLELTRRAVEGTLSQIFGPTELSQDKTVRTLFYTPAELRAQYRSMPASVRAAVTAFAQGINAYENAAYASASSEQADVPYEFFALGQLLGQSGPYRPAPWRPVDTVAVGNFLAREFGGGGGSELTNFQFLNYLAAELTAKGDKHPYTDAAKIFNDARWFNDPHAPTTVPSAAAPSSPPRAQAGRGEPRHQAHPRGPLRRQQAGPGRRGCGAAARPGQHPAHRYLAAGAVARRVERDRDRAAAVRRPPRAAVGSAAGGLRHAQRGRRGVPARPGL